MDIASLYNHYKSSTGVCTDTRKLKSGNIFFALKGPNFNGNAHAAAALDQGASYAVVDEATAVKSEKYILVEDVLTALQQLANYHRKKLGIPIIGITGSNGKTTSKELVNAVLKTKYKTFATEGNLNNHIGVPLTLLSMDEQVEIGIVEMGANHQKEITAYCLIAEPTHGLITNIGKAHLEGFGGIEGVKKGKGELYQYLASNNGIIFRNSGDTVLKSILPDYSVISYPNAGDFLECQLLEEVPIVTFKSQNHKVYTSHLPGKYNFDNIAAALCIGKYFGVEPDQANEAAAGYNPQNNRSQLMNKGTNQILLDAYNANPSSMKAALENFARTNSGTKIVILGDMFELGEESAFEHKFLGELLKSLRFSQVLLCGREMAHAKSILPEANYFETRLQLEEWIKKHPILHSSILIKGSRGMGLENILQYL